MNSKQKYIIYSVLFIITIILIGGIIKHKDINKDAIGIKTNLQSSTQVDRHINNNNSSLNKFVNLSNLPKFIHHNFIEINKISKISKFRSGYGHDFSSGFNETNSCRSMKHYFMIKGIDDKFWSQYYEGKISKTDWPIVKYFAPVSGVIVDMRSSKNMFGDKENQFILESNKYPNIWFGFFHVIVNGNITHGSKIYAGEFLGTISPGNDGEIAVTINPNSDNQLVSFFELIDDNVFAEYKNKGITSRNELIISAKERDENPLVCANNFEKKFIGSRDIPDDKNTYDSWSMSSNNWVFLK